MKEDETKKIFVETTEIKKKNDSFQDTFSTIYSNILIFSIGIEHLGEESLLLNKHLLKTLCSDLVVLIIQNQATQAFVATEKDQPFDKNALISKLPQEIGKEIKKLNDTLTGKSVSEFLEELEKCAEVCDFMLKKLDKRSEKNLLQVHHLALIEQLKKEDNPATVFHLVVILCYLRSFGVMLSAPPRALSSIMEKIKDQIPSKAFAILSGYQQLVVDFVLKNTNNGKAESDSPLMQQMNDIKNIILNVEVNELVERKEIGSKKRIEEEKKIFKKK